VITLAEIPRRILPPQLLEARRSHRLLERQWMVTKAGHWKVLLSGFFEPMFYLFSIRLGFGALVGDIQVGATSVPYAEFVAPALLAAAGMNGPVYEATNVFFKLKYDHVYTAALAAPLTSGDVAISEMVFSTLRGVLYTIAFVVTMWAMGMTSSWWALGLVLVGLVTSMAFSAVALAGVTFMRTYTDFDYIPALLLPLFLFSATFYPVSSYGDWAWVVQLSPLYHSVAIARAFNLGEPSWGLLGHFAVLLVMIVVGLAVATRRIDRLLLQ
jgi:lipooligosaccharide transport system permease protein